MFRNISGVIILHIDVLEALKFEVQTENDSMNQAVFPYTIIKAE